MSDPTHDIFGDCGELSPNFEFPQELMSKIFNPEPVIDMVFGDYPDFDV